MAGPGNEMPERAADGGHFRASHADRERAIEVLKTAFAEERLTKDAFDLRVDQALAARTYAELPAVTSDLRVRPTTDHPAVADHAAAVIAASGFLGYGMIDAWQEHRSRGQLPSRPGQDSLGLESGRHASGMRARTQRGTGPGAALSLSSP